MTLEEKLRETLSRFNEEYITIVQYQAALMDHSRFTRREIETLNSALIDVCLDPIDMPIQTSPNQIFSPQDSCDLIEPISRAANEARIKYRESTETQPPKPSFPADGDAAAHRDSFLKVVDIINRTMPPTVSPESSRGLFRAISGSLNFFKEGVAPETMATLTDLAADFVDYRQYWRRQESYMYLLQEPHQMVIRGRSGLPTAPINVHRQTFLLLLMAFDATVFDLVRVALKADFFGLISKLSKDDKKVSLSDLTAHGSFDRFCDSTIDQQLKGLYVKDLVLFLQKKAGVQLVETSSHFDELLEAILRRNIHIHNRGIVDQRFLNDGCNPHGLKLGDYAEIGFIYWHKTSSLLADAIKGLGKWVDGLIPKGT
jgi:hypothetical protein